MRIERPRALLGLAVLAVLVGLGAPRAVAAQVPDTSRPRGVQLKLVYETRYRDRLAVQSFTGDEDLGRAPTAVHRIIQRDLDYSDRFEMLFNIPLTLDQGPPDYAAWNSLGVVYLVTGSLSASGRGYELRLTLHDVVYGARKEERVFPLPALDDPRFRLAVHRVSDEVVRWATGEQGIAATRIAFTRLRDDGIHELLVVDSDGENLRRIYQGESIYSPAYAPSGTAVAFSETDYVNSDRIVELDLSTGARRTIAERGVPAQTPAYSPDGTRMAMALWIGRGMEIYDYNLAQECCLRRLSQRSRIDMHASYSPDGQWLAFQSDRLGNPHIFRMPAEGGEAVLITPFESGGPGYFTSPDWSPQTSQLVFHGRSSGGVFQIMVANADRPGGPVQQITGEGRSEDPSWAPDGRHIVFSGVRDDGMGLYVIDLVTGRIRPVVTGGRYRMPDWSPVLIGEAALIDER